MLLEYFDALVSKIIFKNKKIILIYFRVKSTFKSNHNHTSKQARWFEPTILQSYKMIF
jgi:hypothetical protein